MKSSVQNAVEKKYDEIQKNLVSYCDDLIQKAVDFRESEKHKHNFTGNLLNSIVAVLYRKGKAVHAVYSNDIVRGPVSVKMTSPKIYKFFNGDYDGSNTSSYEPEIKTDEGYGFDDAREFVSRYEPENGLLFEVALAYTTEYASFVDSVRGTIGTYKMEDYMSRTARAAAIG